MDGQIPQKTPGQKRWVHKGMGGMPEDRGNLLAEPLARGQGRWGWLLEQGHASLSGDWGVLSTSHTPSPPRTILSTNNKDGGHVHMHRQFTRTHTHAYAQFTSTHTCICTLPGHTFPQMVTAGLSEACPALQQSQNLDAHGALANPMAIIVYFLLKLALPTVGLERLLIKP